MVPRRQLCALIELVYPKPDGGRSAVGLERMLRICFLQQWINLPDPGVEVALFDSLAMRRFAGTDLGREPEPDETTICRFRHLLEPKVRAKVERCFVVMECFFRLQQGPLPGAGQERAPAVRDLRVG